MTPWERFDALNEHILLQYHYGSVVYGTMTDKSDVDIICVVDDVIDLSDAVNGMWEFHVGDNLDFQFVNLKRWMEMVANHHIWWLECYGLDRQYIIKGNPEDYMQYFKLDKWKLRQVISQIASNAWAKADKNMTVEKDYDLYRGQKSLFHSLRIMKFGIQIAKFGKIVDYHTSQKLRGSFPVVTYTTESGREITSVYSVEERTPEYEIGDEKMICYDPEDPMMFYFVGREDEMTRDYFRFMLYGAPIAFIMLMFM